MSPKPKSPRGRKTLLTPELQKRMVDVISATGQDKDAYELAGISEASFYGWLKRGTEEPAGPYFEFLGAIKEAKARRRASLVAQIQLAARGGTWQAAAWLLERTESATYALRNKHEITGEDGGPVALVIDLGGK